MRDIKHKPVSCKEVLKDKKITSYMSELIKKTDKDHKERLFKICARDNQIGATEHCVGNECEVIPNADVLTILTACLGSILILILVKKDTLFSSPFLNPTQDT